MAAISPEEARNILGAIRLNNGCIPEDQLVTCPADVRTAIMSMRTKLGKLTKTVADNLFSSDTRFVYELVQNAGDNDYSTPPGDAKYLSFVISSDSITIDSNENGFTEANVWGLCSTGESTKTTREGYIGHFGIGFKSVFQIASRVQVQSGPFSFAFEYTKQSDPIGLGMVTPIDADFEQLPQGVGTRIRLTLIESVTENRERYSDLFNMPDTILLFLEKLDEIRVTDATSDDRRATKVYRSFRRPFNRPEDRIRGVDKISMTDETVSAISSTVSTTNFFYMVEKTVLGLPPDPERPGSTRGRVVVAFPISLDSAPITLRRHVFAYLPLNEVGFKFLIQGDFATQANREGVVDGRRNTKLLDGIAAAFCEAVQQFCLDPDLAYTWTEWLPDVDSITGAFWSGLRPKIMSSLAPHDIAWSWTGKVPDQASHLRYVGEGCLDNNGQPLFQDVKGKEVYLSSRYDQRSLQILRDIGLRDISGAQIIERLHEDLRQDDSRMKSTHSGDDWHTRVARLLCRYFDDRSLPELRSQLVNIKLIPLVDGSWASTEVIPIYFPTTQGSTVPTDLGLPMVSPSAMRIPSRAQLFRHLGVTEVSPEVVVDLIYKQHSSMRSVDSDTCHLHLQYLFESTTEATRNIVAKIWLLTDDEKFVQVSDDSKDRVYFERPGELYGPGHMFRCPNNGRNLLSSQHVHFLHPKYMEYANIDPNISFQSWLEDLGIQAIPQPVSPSGELLSSEFKHIILDRPEQLAGVLKQHWQEYKRIFESTSVVWRALSSSEVPSLDYDGRIQLAETYLPLPKLRDLAASAGVSSPSFFLPMPHSLRDDDLEEWQFMTLLVSQPLQEQVVTVYRGMAENCATDNDRVPIRKCFLDEALIYLAPGWKMAENCFWKGPDWMRCKISLESRYPTLEQFFCVTLGIRNFKWQDCLAELENIRRGRTCELEQVTDVYRWLHDEFRHSSNCDEVRKELEDKKLIFVPQDNVWGPPASCIWAGSNTQIPQRHSIASSYADLEDFFTSMLGVARPDLRMHVDTLKALAENREVPKRLKDVMLLINSMSPQVEDVKSLRKSNIFPVQTPNGKVSLTKSEVEFAIVDRKELKGLFPRIHTLHFSLEEVSLYRPFLLAMGLGNKHMSVLVQEKTDVERGALNDRLTRFLRIRAYALFRCAVHYHSSKARDDNSVLLSQLQNVETYISESISKSSTLMQNGEEHKVTRQKANFHLDASAEGLRLYVPENKSDREVCYLRQLPRRLLRFLGITDAAAEAVINGIVNGSSLSVVDDILEDAGVIEVNGIWRPAEVQEDEQEDEQEDKQEDEQEDGQEDQQEDQQEDRQDDEEEHEREEVISVSIETASATVSRRELPLLVASPSPQAQGRSPPVSIFRPSQAASAVPDQMAHSQRYAALLDLVIRAAAEVELPDCGSCAYSPSSNGHWMAMFGARSPERDRKVGAAGELFVFEVLSRLGLPAFSTANWESTIRHEACMHDKYRELGAWKGSETSDLVYDDIEGRLTDVLHGKRYLDDFPGTAGTLFSATPLPSAGEINIMDHHQSIPFQRPYANRSFEELRIEDYRQQRRYGENNGKSRMTPRYYIEVKTTTSNWDEPLYMSSSQYKRMEQMSRRTSSNDPFYLLVRVFNLEGRLGLRLYLDPMTAKQRGELVFTTDTWKIRPQFSNQPAFGSAQR